MEKKKKQQEQKRMEAKKKQKRTLEGVPEELIMAIITRLPPNSLVRFKCVSKPWNTLISSPSFIKLHLNQAISSIRSQRLMVSSSLNSIQSIDYEASEVSAINQIDIIAVANSDRFKIVGSCNGLICVADEENSYHSFILWNPCIREFKKLPLRFPLAENLKVSIGFGYDQSANDYKVVRCTFDETLGSHLVFEIHSMKSNTQKVIRRYFSDPRITFSDHNSKKVVFVDGVLYLKANSCSFRRDNLEYDDAVLGLDLKDEKLEIVQLPDDHVNFDEDPELELGIFRGCLGAIQCYFGTMIHIWALKNDGMKQSWIKLMRIMELQSVPDSKDLIPVCFMRNGEVLMTCTKKEESASKSVFRKLKVHGLRPWFHEITYTQTLVSPKLL
ncbi:F-box protein CPR30-like [Durio zibethinus]|uniref:F-box protein CPR30-like n=1 Tax=Durio zibethinus TaxID=66656 RepID=A0A6P5Y2J0_DURZI|nr:F-box protein CPR30-like [Durio zibethinus]